MSDAATRAIAKRWILDTDTVFRIDVWNVWTIQAAAKAMSAIAVDVCALARTVESATAARFARSEFASIASRSVEKRRGTYFD